MRAPTQAEIGQIEFVPTDRALRGAHAFNGCRGGKIPQSPNEPIDRHGFVVHTCERR